jgi:predicted nucleotidyltransferase component of viral defense system
MKSPIQAVESFHLAFLRALETKLDRAGFVIKGGVNLRAWFGSLRYSEDLDIDVIDIEPYVLREAVDKVLAGTPLQALLKVQQIAITRTSKPKQTDTTQRWKLELRSEGLAVALPTKVEFSRRVQEDEFTLEPVRPEVLRPYGIPAPTLNHYTASAAVRQKLGALIGRRETQARDIWDLEHLFRTTRADPRPLPAKLAGALQAAIDRVFEMQFEYYKSQVVSYLDPEHQELYGTPEAWDRIRELVIDRLEELKK